MTLTALEEIDENISTFDATAFARQALAGRRTLAAAIDHTLLKPEATREQVLKLCAEAAEHRFACAMVNPAWVPTAYAALAGTGVPVGVVVGFPWGQTSPRASARRLRRWSVWAHASWTWC